MFQVAALTCGFCLGSNIICYINASLVSKCQSRVGNLFPRISNWYTGIWPSLDWNKHILILIGRATCAPTNSLTLHSLNLPGGREDHSAFTSSCLDFLHQSVSRLLYISFFSISAFIVFTFTGTLHCRETLYTSLICSMRRSPSGQRGLPGGPSSFTQTHCRIRRLCWHFKKHLNTHLFKLAVASCCLSYCLFTVFMVLLSLCDLSLPMN